MKKFALLILALSLQACATVGMMPKSASEVDFDGVEGKTGWSQYQHVETFHNYNTDQIYEASKVGLGSSESRLIQLSAEQALQGGHVNRLLPQTVAAPLKRGP